MILLYDNITAGQITVDATKRTADGYLAASARVARTGIQIYSGRECGRPDLEFVRVYRPADEVFKADAIKTFAHRPITDDHPHQPVTADNWRTLSKGHTGEEVVRDGKFIRVPMLLMDGPTIKKWEDGKRELSMGYSCDLKWEDGITEDGEEYDAVQTNIKANHLALVKKARGGEDLHIGDGMKTCPECGHRMPDGAKECTECGHEMLTDAGNPYHDPDDGKFTSGPGGSKDPDEDHPVFKRALKTFERQDKVHATSMGEEEARNGKIKTENQLRRKWKGRVSESFIETMVEVFRKTRTGNDSADTVLTADDLDIEDDNTGDQVMKTVMVDGISCAMEDQVAQIVSRALDKAAADFKALNDEFSKMKEEEEKKKKKYETDAAELTTKVAELTTQNAQLTTKLADAEVTPAKLEALAADRMTVIDKATAILGKDKFDKTASSAAIRRACVNHVVGDAAKDWSDDLVSASFATIKAAATGDGVRKLADGFVPNQQGNTTVLDEAHDKYLKRITEASRTKAA